MTQLKLAIQREMADQFTYKKAIETIGEGLRFRRESRSREHNTTGTQQTDCAGITGNSDQTLDSAIP